MLAHRKYDIEPQPDENAHSLGGTLPNQGDIIGALHFNIPISFYFPVPGFSVSATIDEVRRLDMKGNCWEVKGEAEYGHDVPRRRYRAQFRIRQRHGWLEYID